MKLAHIIFGGYRLKSIVMYVWCVPLIPIWFVRIFGSDSLPVLRAGRGGRTAEGWLQRTDRTAAPADTQDHL